MASSLEHLCTDHVDSFALHGPASHSHWTTEDFETWQAMIKERDAGRTRLLGVSNISLAQLQQMARAHAEPPAFVQNRCYASCGWDREVRDFCRERNIIYQGFSLLTANRQVLGHPTIAALAAEINATPAQLIFAFARQVGMLPLTGTSSADHMRQDLQSRFLQLPVDAVDAIEAIAG
jgi:diketogulonate reductase-like aldo/keto reductase